MQRFQWVLTVLATLFFTPLVLAEGDAVLPVVVAPGSVAVVTNVQGSLSAAKTGVAPRSLAVYDNVAEGEVLSTAAGAYARVKFLDGGELILRPNSQAEITRYAFVAATPASDGAIITLIKGGLRSLTGLMGKRNPEQVTFKSKTATIGIRGTDFGLLECKNNCGDVMPPGTPPPPNGTHVDVTQGSVAVITPIGQLVVNAGQFAYVKSQTALPQRVPATKGVKVTVPPTIRKDPPPKPQTTASTSKSKTQAKSNQAQPTVAAAAAPASTTSSSSSSQADASQSQPSSTASTGKASAAATSGISSDLSAAISQLPATPALSGLQTAAQSQPAGADSVDTSSSTSSSSPAAAALSQPAAASTASAFPTGSAFDSSAQVPAGQSSSSAVAPASSWTSTASIGNSADLSTAISQLPATAAGPVAAPTLPSVAPSIGASFGASPASSLGGGGGRAVSRN